MGREVVEPLLKIRNLTVGLSNAKRSWTGLKGIDLDVAHGETLGIVGESGSGKTLLALSILRLLEGQRLSLDARPAQLEVTGEIEFLGRSLLALDEVELRRVRGKGISLIFQDSLSSLNPVMRIGRQLVECFGVRTAIARREVLELLEQVGFSDPAEIFNSYPHQLSGGMRQRVCIAMAIASKPRLLIADEPTTALDSTTQLHILNLLHDLREKSGMSLLLISHDLRVISYLCDRILVMNSGSVVETSAKTEFFALPKTPYSTRLICNIPTPVFKEPTDFSKEEILEINEVSLRYAKPSFSQLLFGGAKSTFAVKGVSLKLFAGEVFGLLGESGSGKTSLGRCILRIAPGATGSIRFEGVDLTKLSYRKLIPIRKRLQLIFQDPGAALNPRLTVKEILGEPIEIHSLARSREEKAALLLKCLREVELGEEVLGLFPSQLSGGQKQRICIARALILSPRLLVCDEPFTALDTAVQAQMVELLRKFQKQSTMTLFMISHDLNLVGALADRIGVMFDGKIVEVATTSELMTAPLHPYSETLVRMRLELFSGSVQRVPTSGQALSRPSSEGCAYFSRCELRKERCSKEVPPLSFYAPSRQVACFFPRGVSVSRRPHFSAC